MENDNLFVLSEPYRVRQLIVTILGNAIRYMLKEKIQLRVEMMERAGVRMGVSDTGRGIKPEERDVTVEPFSPSGCSTPRTSAQRDTQYVGYLEG